MPSARREFAYMSAAMLQLGPKETRGKNDLRGVFHITDIRVALDKSSSCSQVRLSDSRKRMMQRTVLHHLYHTVWLVLFQKSPGTFVRRSNI